MQTGKQAFTYVFDRTNGQPVWPIPETPVVSEARRTAGRTIAIALLVVLVVGAVWFIYHAAPKT